MLGTPSPMEEGGRHHYSLWIWASVSLITAEQLNVWHFIFKNREAITAAVTLGERKMLLRFQ